MLEWSSRHSLFPQTSMTVCWDVECLVFWQDICIMTVTFWFLLQPPQFSFYDAAKPIFTSPRFLPPTKIEQCQVFSNSFHLHQRRKLPWNFNFILSLWCFWKWSVIPKFWCTFLFNSVKSVCCKTKRLDLGFLRSRILSFPMDAF